ncbi:hypothetical protein SCOCK_500006 [Actinacidiphila cocklensis]|uniref:Uncharacterized protein n=1 Tax=Actinacidiphila cocklensis TaxID=887465 RepID=A0A9W4E172_9ACTN|nr:hypothetical protein SCOCK_500006 [Actinacidiphila cocklensis]
MVRLQHRPDDPHGAGGRARERRGRGGGADRDRRYAAGGGQAAAADAPGDGDQDRGEAAARRRGPARHGHRGGERVRRGLAARPDRGHEGGGAPCGGAAAPAHVCRRRPPGVAHPPPARVLGRLPGPLRRLDRFRLLLPLPLPRPRRLRRPPRRPPRTLLRSLDRTFLRPRPHRGLVPPLPLTSAQRESPARGKPWRQEDADHKGRGELRARPRRTERCEPTASGTHPGALGVPPGEALGAELRAKPAEGERRPPAARGSASRAAGGRIRLPGEARPRKCPGASSR